jgi:hypothetical protein
MINSSKIIDNFLGWFMALRSNSRNLAGYLFVRIYLAIVIIFNAIDWLFAFFITNNITGNGERTVLHYNVDFGIDLIGGEKSIYVIPMLGLIIIIINFFVLLILGKRKEFVFIAYFMFSVSLLVNILLALALSSLYLINLT